MRPLTRVPAESGFSLIEVMVALIIICVGLLGIAKLEALMLSSTGTSRLRALIALQAASLADAMHADRDYWDGSSTYWIPANGALSASASESSGTTTWSGPNAPPAGINCMDALCNPEQLADYDLNQWASNLTAFLKNSQSSITCSSAAATSAVTCTISISWNENTVAANSQEARAGAPTTFQQQTYTLMVAP